MPLNALYQLAASIRDGSPLLDQAASMLTIADLFNYWLTGSKTCEFTEATTMQLYNPALADWDREIMDGGRHPDRLPDADRATRHEYRNLPGH